MASEKLPTTSLGGRGAPQKFEDVVSAYGVAQRNRNHFQHLRSRVQNVPRDAVSLVIEEDEYMISRDALVFARDDDGFPVEIGHGDFSRVYKGKLKEETVAIKKYNVNLQQLTRVEAEELQEEYEIWKSLNDANILQLIGVCKDKNSFLLIMPLCSGSLHDYLTTNNMPPESKLELAFQIACGMDYLHGMNILHRDLKDKNILIHEGVAKICDFGKSKPIDVAKTVQTGSFAYMAPEVMKCGRDFRWTAQQDIYSYGMVIYVILTGNVPFEKEQSVALISVQNQQRPKVPDEALTENPHLVDLMKRCWQHHPRNRPPNFRRIVSELYRVMESVSNVQRDEKILNIAERAGCQEKQHMKLKSDMNELQHEVSDLKREVDGVNQNRDESSETVQQLQAVVQDLQRQIVELKEDKKDSSASSRQLLELLQEEEKYQTLERDLMIKVEQLEEKTDIKQNEMLSQLQELLKWKGSFAKHQGIDAQDNDGTWRVSYIKDVDVDNGTVLVQFKGLPAEQNEWLSLKSSRIAPKRKFTLRQDNIAMTRTEVFEDRVEMLLRIGNLEELKMNHQLHPEKFQKRKEAYLSIASESGHYAVIQWLLSFNPKPNVDVVGKAGETPLFTATHNGSTSVVQLLVDNNADVNLPNEIGTSCLHHAATVGQFTMITLLIRAKADINLRDKFGDTALTRAAQFGHYNLVQLLLCKGAEFSATNIVGKTACQVAQENGHSKIEELLRNRRLEDDSDDDDLPGLITRSNYSPSPPPPRRPPGRPPGSPPKNITPKNINPKNITPKNITAPKIKIKIPTPDPPDVFYYESSDEDNESDGDMPGLDRKKSAKLERLESCFEFLADLDAVDSDSSAPKSRPLPEDSPTMLTDVSADVPQAHLDMEPPPLSPPVSPKPRGTPRPKASSPRHNSSNTTPRRQTRSMPPGFNSHINIIKSRPAKQQLRSPLQRAIPNRRPHPPSTSSQISSRPTPPPRSFDRFNPPRPNTPPIRSPPHQAPQKKNSHPRPGTASPRPPRSKLPKKPSSPRSKLPKKPSSPRCSSLPRPNSPRLRSPLLAVPGSVPRKHSSGGLGSGKFPAVILPNSKRNSLGGSVRSKLKHMRRASKSSGGKSRRKSGLFKPVSATLPSPSSPKSRVRFKDSTPEFQLLKHGVFLFRITQHGKAKECKCVVDKENGIWIFRYDSEKKKDVERTMRLYECELILGQQTKVFLRNKKFSEHRSTSLSLKNADRTVDIYTESPQIYDILVKYLQMLVSVTIL